MEAFHLGPQGPWDEGKSCRTEHLAPASRQRRKDPLGESLGRQGKPDQRQGRRQGPGRGAAWAGRAWAARGLRTAGGGLARGSGGPGPRLRVFWATRRPQTAGCVGRAWRRGARPRQRLCFAEPVG